MTKPKAITVKSTGEIVDPQDRDALAFAYQQAAEAKATADADMVALATAVAKVLGPLDRSFRSGKLKVSVNGPTRKEWDAAKLRAALRDMDVAPEVLDAVVRPEPQEYKVMLRELAKLEAVDDEEFAEKVADAIGGALTRVPQNRRLYFEAIKPSPKAAA